MGMMITMMMMMMMSTFIAHDSKEGEGGREKVVIIKIKKKDTWCKVIQRTGGFSDACGTPPSNLLPRSFVERQSRA